METLHPCEVDALSVDELLDFSFGDIGGPCDEGDGCLASTCEQENETSCLHVSAADSSVLAQPRPSSSSTQEPAETFYSPPEELAGELEWLSMFMEDSYRGADQSMPLMSSEQWFSKGSSRTDGCRESSPWVRPATTSWLRMSKSGTFCEFLDVGNSPLIEVSPSDSMKSCRWDKRGRSKRSSRSGGRVWSLQTVLVPKRAASAAATAHHRPEMEGEEEEEEEEHSQASSLDYEPFQGYEAEQPARKKVKKERVSAAAGEEGRRCSHCQVQKTPQWRAGPLGPKTLCNACGVRYKSGRLLPEYRPAASPTFVSDLHSNSHKKVLEMRNSKSSVRISPPPSPPRPTNSPPYHHYHCQQHQDHEEFSSCSQESMNSLHLQTELRA